MFTRFPTARRSMREEHMKTPVGVRLFSLVAAITVVAGVHLATFTQAAQMIA